MAVDWRAYLPTQDVYEDALLDVYVRDAYNRFARKADILMDDIDGSLIHRYSRGTPVELEVDDGSGWQRRFAGFVVDPQTRTNETEVELYGHDLWLRKRNVITNYTEMTPEEILQDLVTRLTPLQWNPDLVGVDYTDPISVKFKGQQLDEVINELSHYSNNEDFGATDDRKFYFRRQDARRSPCDFGPGDYLDASFDEDGTKEINQVTVYYGEGDDTAAVTVDDRDSQRGLRENLGAQNNVVLDVTRTYPEIETEEMARLKADDILAGRTTIRTGTITTWEAFDVLPGDVAVVEIPEHDVDDRMRVAQIEYHWMEDETEITLAGGGEGVVDALVDLSDVVERVETQPADADALQTRFVVQELGYELAIDLSMYERTVPDDQFLFGDWHGNLGHPDVGGGYLGDMTGDWQPHGE